MSDYSAQQEMQSEQPENKTLDIKFTKEYVSFANRIRNSAIISIVLQVVIGIALVLWLGVYSVFLVIPAIAVFQVLRRAYRWNRKQVYHVEEYRNGKLYDSYDTNGGIIGGLFITFVLVGIFLLVVTWFQKKFLPDSSIVWFLLVAVCMMWIIAASNIKDIRNLRLARMIYRMAAPHPMISYNRPIAEAIEQWHEKDADSKIKLHIVMICIIIGILVVQFAVGAIRAPFITAKLDHHEVYHRYLESDFADDDLLPLTEEWFEEALEQKDAKDYKKLWTSLTLEAEASMDFNGITRDVEMRIVYKYTDGRWRVDGCSLRDSHITAVNISGVWEGTGKDRNISLQSNESHMTLTIHSLTDTHVEGTLESVSSDGRSYCKDFVGEVKKDSGKFTISGEFVSDSERIKFTYDPYTDTIDDMSWSWASVLTRVE